MINMFSRDQHSPESEFSSLQRGQRTVDSIKPKIYFSVWAEEHVVDEFPPINFHPNIMPNAFHARNSPKSKKCKRSGKAKWGIITVNGEHGRVGIESVETMKTCFWHGMTCDPSRDIVKSVLLASFRENRNYRSLPQPLFTMCSCVSVCMCWWALSQCLTWINSHKWNVTRYPPRVYDSIVISLSCVKSIQKNVRRIITDNFSSLHPLPTWLSSICG